MPTPAPTPLTPGELQRLAERFTAVFPQMGPAAQGVAVALYRLLGAGKPVHWRALANAVGQTEPQVQSLVRNWPGVYEAEGKVTGFGGLSVLAVSEHRIQISREPLYGRCAWDTLFLPFILGRAADVASFCARTGTPVRMLVTPDRISHLQPAGAVLSMLEPEPAMTEDITQHF